MEEDPPRKENRRICLERCLSSEKRDRGSEETLRRFFTALFLSDMRWLITRGAGRRQHSYFHYLSNAPVPACQGIRILPLCLREGRALIYMYRPERLEKDLKDSRAEAILKKEHYPEGRPECRLKELSTRLRSSENFPHEIGLFLGYPPEDVEGFILNHAKGYKCIGCWKVYGDEQAARKKFEAFNLCTKCCCSYRNRGMSVEKMVVREKPDTPVQ